MAPGGILGQWIPFYNQDEEESKALLKALLEVFPEVTLWSTDRLDTFALASDRPLRIDYARLEARMATPAVRAALDEIGVPGPPALLATFLMDRAALERYAGSVPAITDDHPRIEFFLPVDLRARIPTASELPDLFERVIDARSPDPSLGRILDVPPERREAVLEEVRSYRAAMVACYEAEIARGRGLEWKSAEGHEAAVARDPANDYFLFFLGADDGAVARALEAVRASGASPAAVARLAFLRIVRREFDEAFALARRLVDAAPGAPDGRYLLGRALEGRGDFAGAERAYEEALALAPGHATSRLALGLLRIDHLGEREAGADDVREAARLDPALGPAADQALFRAGVR
jgi:hypothetical protein